MSTRFSPRNLLHTDRLIYISPILLFVSLFHIFSAEDATRSFGKLEIMGALAIIAYYLWDKIPEIYGAEKTNKKRIEAVICIVVSILLALLPFPPLMTWQFYNLYKATDQYSYTRPIVTAVLSSWVAVILLFAGAYNAMSDRMAIPDPSAPEESSYVAPTGAAQ